MKEIFKDKNFRSDSLLLIDVCNSVIEEYQSQGYNLTLRQLYYQLVARDIIENSQQSYNKIGSLLSDARLAGLVDWDAIEDRTRNLESPSWWSSPASILRSCKRSYKEDLWADQPYYVEVWVEKEALSGVIESACEEYRVPFMACRGYMSQSEQYSAAKRFEEAERNEQESVVLHLGDHDPSGMDMTRDNQDRLFLLSNMTSINVKRIALNMDQIEELKPPPNPAKMTDSRFRDYVLLHGDKSWELDALQPQYINNLIADELAMLIDPDVWEESKAEEEQGKEKIQLAIDNLDDD